MKKNTAKLLTEVELQMMSALWNLKEGTVAEVMQALLPARKLAYTSVSTMMRILEQKGAVASRKAGRGHVYFPVLQKAEYERKSLKHMVDNVFDGAPSHLIQRLLEVDGLSHEDVQQLKKLLDEHP